MDSDVLSLADAPYPEETARYSYSVQASWKGHSSSWSAPDLVVVGSAIPGKVRELRYVYEDLKVCILSFDPPEWPGYSSITAYEVERFSEGWHKVDARRLDGYSTGKIALQVRKVSPGGLRHRVRAINGFGAGFWSEETYFGVRIYPTRRNFRDYSQTFEAGQVIEGRVEALQGYGAFVSLGKQISGLLHRSELMWFDNPEVSDVVQVGDLITVKVVAVDARGFKGKVKLSLREAQGDPWDEFSWYYKEGTVLSGVVDGLAGFGAFVRLGGSVKGLIHKSELGVSKVNHPKDVLRVGQRIKVKILKIDLDRRQVALTLRDL